MVFFVFFGCGYEVAKKNVLGGFCSLRRFSGRYGGRLVMRTDWAYRFLAAQKAA